MNDLGFAFRQLMKNHIHGLSEFSRKGCESLKSATRSRITFCSNSLGLPVRNACS